ncbi:unnamed protein product [Lactuca virosa]|uniref:Uncharacterized protein n=1 Tax=Lactuca virosa TaxID=75947 RepID=A0AAU9PMG5_9ASTR|nr:unnamed protein product [Lactuca virosa]CAH1451143.1 unnamed protein product [Lactuca virosa]
MPNSILWCCCWYGHGQYELNSKFLRFVSKMSRGALTIDDNQVRPASGDWENINSNIMQVRTGQMNILILSTGQPSRSGYEDGTCKEYPLGVVLEATKNTLIQGNTKLLLDFRVVLDQELGLILKLRDMMFGWIHEGFQSFLRQVNDEFLKQEDSPL